MINLQDMAEYIHDLGSGELSKAHPEDYAYHIATAARAVGYLVSRWEIEYER